MNTWKNQFWYILFIIAFTALSFYAVKSTSLNNQERERAQEEQAREALESIQNIWEKGVFTQVESWYSALNKGMTERELEEQLRQDVPWFDSVYLWSQSTKQMEYPQFNLTVPRHDCLEKDPKLSDCQEAPIEVQNWLSLQQAKVLLQDGKTDLAQQRAKSFSPPLSSSPAQPALSESGVLYFLKRRNILYKTESLRGELGEGHLLLQDSLVELQKFDAPIIQLFFEDLPATLNMSENYSQEILQRLRRRVRAYEEIDQVLRKEESVSDVFLIRSDPYSDRPFLLLYKSEQQRAMAFSLDPALLLDTLFPTSAASSNIRPAIIDAEGQPLLRQGQQLTGDEELWVQIPGGRLFPHLRLAYIRKTTVSPIVPTLISQLLPILLTGALGFVALLGSFRADRRQREFVSRQQAFIARVTHEFKTPLAGIKLMAESLQMGVLKDPSQSEIFVEKILAETDRLEQRIDEVLQVARRAELKRMELIDSEILMYELYDVWQPRFVEIQGTLRLEREASDFFGDLDLIRDAIDNLLSNAIKYRHPKKNLRTILEIAERGNWIEISVSDNGIGVPISERKRIFERFVRIETDNRGFSGGHGLGLAFVAEAAEAHKGTIKCSDGIDGGTKFSFRIPKNRI